MSEVKYCELCGWQIGFWGCTETKCNHPMVEELTKIVEGKEQ